MSICVTTNARLTMYSVDDFNVIAYIWHLPELIYNSCDLPSKPQNTSIFYNHYNDPVGKVKHTW